MKIVSWNVNGIVSCRRKGLLKFLNDVNPDICCFQEIKTKAPLKTPGYLQYWNVAERSGYSGTLVLTKREPLDCTFGFGVRKYDAEGRLITLEYPDYYILNVYVPSLHVHSGSDRERFRRKWDAEFRKYVQRLQENKPVILCGDFNVAHRFIDSYPENGKNEPDEPLFQSDIRESFDALLSTGLVDAYRVLHPQQEGAYTWWGPKNRNRNENRGSRLDYFLLSGELLPNVHAVSHYRDTQGSDHCPIVLKITPSSYRDKMDEEDLAVLWRTTDWEKLRDELWAMQKELALAAFEQKWPKVEQLQKKLVRSWAAKAQAVQSVVKANSELGVDGVRWKTDAEKCKAARMLTSWGYHPMPYRHTEIMEANGKRRIIHVPTYRDKAMITLYAYSLDPVAESIADKKSFAMRQGRSALDLHAYLMRDLSGSNAPEIVIVIDVQSFYGSAIHAHLLDHAPMDKSMLRKFLKAGEILQDCFQPTEQGMSMGTALSPILGNLLLDGIQSRIYDRLYPQGNVDYLNGDLFRFCDDILITARSWEQAECILQIAVDFLEERGLRPNMDKTKIVNVCGGFTFLGRHYQKRNGMIIASPSAESIRRMEQDLDELITRWSGSLRGLIEKINAKLRGWAAYHRVEDAYMEFRHIDAIVEGLLVNKMCRKYPRWHRETILNKFWIRDGAVRIFALPDDPSIRVQHLATTPIVQHKPCKLSFNPYLDEDYYAWLQNKRQIQKVSGKYRSVWTRQQGKCAYCGQPMLPDQELEIVEKELGAGRQVRNLLYIHRWCIDTYAKIDGDYAEGVDLFSLLDGLMDDAAEVDSPFLELREYFRHQTRTPLSLSFQQMEYILGDPLPWEAYYYEAFWYDDQAGMGSPLWRQAGFPFHFFRESTPGYCAADSWISQGYVIKALHLNQRRVVFRRVLNCQAALDLPKELTRGKIPEAAVHEANQFFRHLIEKYGL